MMEPSSVVINGSNGQTCNPHSNHVRKNNNSISIMINATSDVYHSNKAMSQIGMNAHKRDHQAVSGQERQVHANLEKKNVITLQNNGEIVPANGGSASLDEITNASVNNQKKTISINLRDNHVVAQGEQDRSTGETSNKDNSQQTKDANTKILIPTHSVKLDLREKSNGSHDESGEDES